MFLRLKILRFHAKQRRAFAFTAGTLIIRMCLFCALGQDAQDLRDLSKQLVSLYNQRHYREAVPIAEQVLKLTEARFGKESAATTTCLRTLADIYERLGDYRKAEPLLEMVLHIRENEGPEEVGTADSLVKMAHVYYLLGKNVEAERLFKRGLTIYEKQLGLDNPSTITCQNELAVLYAAMGDYSKAEALYQTVLSKTQSVFGQVHENTAASLHNLAELYTQMGNYQKAEPLYLKSLSIFEKTVGPEHPSTAACLNHLGSLYAQMGELEKVEPVYERAVRINEKVFGPEHPAIASCINNLAFFYTIVGEYNKAEPLYQRAIRIDERAFGAEHPKTATALNNLAELYVETGAYSKAKSLQQRALSIDEKVLGPEHPNSAIVLTCMAELSKSAGDYATAEILYQRALSVFEKAFGTNNAQLATTLCGMAQVYMEIGDYAKAEPLYQRALSIHEIALGPNHPSTAASLNNLADLYARLHQYEKAEPLFQQALSIEEKVFGQEHLRTAGTLNNLAVLYKATGDYAKADLFFQQTLKIQEKILGSDNPIFGRTLYNQAGLYHGIGQYTRAEPLYQRALEILKNKLGEDHPSTAACFNNLAFLSLDLTNMAGAAELAAKGEQAMLKKLNNILSFASEQERLLYEKECNPYSLFVGLGEVPQLTLAILRNKGVVLDSILEDRLIASSTDDPGDRLLVEQLREAKQRLTQATLVVPKVWTEAALQDRVAVRAKLTDEVSRLEGLLGRKVAALGGTRRALSIKVEQVQAEIPPNSVLVELLQYHHYLGAMKSEVRYGAAIVASSGEPKWVCLGSASGIDKNILLYQALIRRYKEPDDRRLANVLRTMYQQLWSPLESILPPGATNIIISPDGGLNFVSFATLLTVDNQFLAEKYFIRYVASGRDLVREVPMSASKEMVVFANPRYSTIGTGTLPNSELFLRSLPETAAQAAALEANAKAARWPVTVYLSDEATEARLRTVNAPHILHFATHGFFLPERVSDADRLSYGGLDDHLEGGFRSQVVLRNPMLRSGLALAGAQDTLDAWKRGETPPTSNDGVVTAEEVGSLHLEGTWVVSLSACDTAVGEVLSGEGVMGLRRGFVQAGAKNLLMTLWPVTVNETERFMVEFYSALRQNNNPPASLATVQRQRLVKQRQEHGLFAAVFLDGPFILSSQGPLP